MRGPQNILYCVTLQASPSSLQATSFGLKAREWGGQRVGLEGWAWRGRGCLPREQRGSPSSHPSVPHPQARAQGSSASGPVPLTLPDLGIGFYTTDFIAFLYNSRSTELERPWRSTSICPHSFHG